MEDVDLENDDEISPIQIGMDLDEEEDLRIGEEGSDGGGGGESEGNQLELKPIDDINIDQDSK